MNKTIAKSMLIWAGIIPLAIANGALRELILLPLLGDVSLPVSGVLLALCIFAIAFIFIPRLLPVNQKLPTAKIGLTWLTATLIFETVMGLALGNSPTEILQNYDVSNGNLWLFIVIFVGIVPSIVVKMKI